MEGVVNLSDRTAISSSLEAVGSCFEQDMVCSYVIHVVFFFQIMKAHCPTEITKNAESCRCLIMTRKNTIETVSRQQACVHSQKSDLQSSLQKAIAVRSNGFDPFDCQSSKKVPELKVESFLKPQNSTLVNPMCVMSSSKRSSSKFNDQMAGSPSSQLFRKKETVLPEARRQWWLSHELPHC